MNASWLISFLFYLETLLCATAIFYLFRTKTARSYLSLIALLAVRLASDLVMLSLIHLPSLSVQTCYRIYFYVYWGSYAVEAVLALLVIYSIFKLSMAPLKGLQNLGMMIFHWIAAISVVVTIGLAIAPNQTSTKFIISLVTQMQRTSSILTLCLLVFVTFAIRPMGLNHRSRIFGVCLGLGIMASTSLVVVAWFSHHNNMQSTLDLVNGIAMCTSLSVWTVYFAIPEPKRRMILLPTTSPFLRWNQISMALGDDPGYVAVGGVAPDVFAPAEIELMKKASALMPAKLDTTASLHSLSA